MAGSVVMGPAVIPEIEDAGWLRLPRYVRRRIGNALHGHGRRGCAFASAVSTACLGIEALSGQLAA